MEDQRHFYEEDDDESFAGPDAYVEGDDDFDDEEPDYEYEAELAAEVAGLAEDTEEEASPLRGIVGPGISIRDLSHFIQLTNAQLSTHIPMEEEVDDDDDDDSGSGGSHNWFPAVKEPQEAGVQLLMSGEFGRVGNKIRSRNGKTNIARVLRERGLGLKRSPREDIASTLIPNSNGVAVASYDSNAYSGQYSADSSFYYTCVQDFRLHVYDTTAPPTQPAPSVPRQPRTRRTYQDPEEAHRTTMKVINTVQGHPGRWTITDSHLSPDAERIIYSSISPTVYMASVHDPSAPQIPLRFSDPPRRERVWGLDEYSEHCSIWSCRFSADGNEVIGGGSGKIYVFDLLANQRTVKIDAHDEDVNSCCWADSASGNVLISASDDTFVKVWDRRSLGSSQKPSGVLVGHTEGITNVSAKGDGRYIISNGKDQALRLWDLRKMKTSDEFDRMPARKYGIKHFDYRCGRYPKPRFPAHPQDCSVMTYRGHSVLNTLIRCHFSPVETTGGQYLYSGSADGRIHIWSLDGRIVQILDRSKTLSMNFDPSGPVPGDTNGLRDHVCVRDVSWHSKQPVLMSVGWSGDRSQGSVVAKHEWKGLNKMGRSLEDWIEKQRLERTETQGRAARFSIPGSFQDGDSDDE